jgi:hypothetical protein
MDPVQAPAFESPGPSHNQFTEQDHTTEHDHPAKQDQPEKQDLPLKHDRYTQPVGGHFRVMDLPVELRLLIWSQALPFWSLEIDATARELTFGSRASNLLQVSKHVRREVASLATSELRLDRTSRNKHQAQILKFWELSCAWGHVSSMHPCNYLSRFRFVFTAENLTQFEFNFIQDSKNDVTVAGCGRRRLFPPGQWSAIETERTTEVQKIVRWLNVRKAPLVPRGIYLFVAILAYP